MNKVVYNPLVIGCLSAFILTLGACGGGGGGGTTTDIAPPPAPTTTTTIVNGISQETDYTASGGAIATVTPQESKTGAFASITTNNADGVIQKIAVTTPNGTVTWDKNSGDTIETLGVVLAASNSSSLGVVINTDDPGVPWEYQTFGIWETGLDSTMGKIGSITVGAPTTGSDIPGSGTVDFDGVSGGIHVDFAGKTYITASEVNATVDFNQRTIAMDTFGTTKIDPSTTAIGSVGIDAANLDMSGTLTYQSGVNSFTGTVTSISGLTGSSTGQFYGPVAQELGGVFSLKASTGRETYQGAYGAVQK